MSQVHDVDPTFRAEGPMIPAEYDDTQYAAMLAATAKAQEVVFLSGCFAPKEYPSSNQMDGKTGSNGSFGHFLAATSRGVIYVWDLGHYMSDEYAKDPTSSNTPPPEFTFQAHENQVYALSFSSGGKDSLLITGGDTETRVWKWSAILDEFRHRASELPRTSIVHVRGGPNEDIVPIWRWHNTPLDTHMMSSISETNDLSNSTHNNHIFAACGDNVVREWDCVTGKLVRCLKSKDTADSVWSGVPKNNDYLLTVSYVSEGHQVVAGADSGAVRIWDSRQQNPAPTFELTPLGKNGQGSGYSSGWISSLDVDASGNWLICGGGYNTSLGSSPRKGHLTMFDLPSRQRVPLDFDVESEVQSVKFSENSSGGTTEFFAVGNDPYLRSWDAFSGTRQSSVRLTIPSSHFLCLSGAELPLVIGGASPYLNTFAVHGVRSLSLGSQVAIK